MFKNEAGGPPGDEVLDCAAMAAADAFAVRCGVSPAALMECAGQAVARAIMHRWAPRQTAILCGPGNNGGDGYVAARLLQAAGWKATVFELDSARPLTGEAEAARRQWNGPRHPLAAFRPEEFGLTVDALFGAGLARPLEGGSRAAVEAGNAASLARVAVDVPSGIRGDSARVNGVAFRADVTVTFHRLKPAHLFEPARSHCGEIVCADIRIPDGWQSVVPPLARLARLDRLQLPAMAHRADVHKHQRGRLCVLAGGVGATSAARLSAEAGLAMGSGLVTVLCPPASLIEAAHAALPLMVRALRDDDFGADLERHRANALVLGPGAGVNDTLKTRVLAALAAALPVVLDADALSVFADDPSVLLGALHAQAVLTPHAGEFERLFPGLLADSATPLEAARQAAAKSGAIILLKGPATVIAAPSGEAVINANASARLATAGSGDVLAGMIGGLMAQGMAPLEAAVSAAWLHGQAGFLLPPGGNAQDLIARIPAVLGAALDEQARRQALARLAGNR